MKKQSIHDFSYEDKQAALAEAYENMNSKEGKTVKKEVLDIAILAIHNGEIHFLSMEKDRLEAIAGLAKMAAVNIFPTGKSRTELLEFLNYGEEK